MSQKEIDGPDICLYLITNTFPFMKHGEMKGKCSFCGNGHNRYLKHDSEVVVEEKVQHKRENGNSELYIFAIL